MARWTRVISGLLLGLALLAASSAPVRPARAQGSGPPAGCMNSFFDTTINPPYGEWVCLDGGSSPGGPGGGNTPAPSTCVPNGTSYTLTSYVFVTYDGGSYDFPLCSRILRTYDNCGTGLGMSHILDPLVACPMNEPAKPPVNIDPCPAPNYDNGFGCSSWSVRASVGPPGTTLAARPYPATLVRWDTALRFDGIHAPSGTGFIAVAGDYRNYRLTLYFQPASSEITVYMEQLGVKRLTLGQTIYFKYEVPSHPVVGGDDLASAVGQLQELPGDMPLFRNMVAFPFELYCRAELLYWDGLAWRPYSITKKINPNDVAGMPDFYKLDTNGDGVADAFGGGTTILRMNDAGSTSDPVWRHSYSWGSVFFWAVREGQGQIGWP